ncbi:MAG TPA: MMPL family transporter [Verrucomicrobia bacterium]|nr:MMPL family transporter [Verrucomicrobiota bacterium]HOP96769.1 MMPL family transporter [Verrucomicrobiota bacterium]
MKSLTDNSPVARALGALARAVCRHRRFFFYSNLVLFLASVWYTVQFLEFSTRRNDLVGSDKTYHQNFLRFREEFPRQDDLVVVVESDDSEKNRQFVERLAARLEANTNLYEDVFYRGDLTMLGRKALLFLPEENLVQLEAMLKEYRGFIQRFSTTTNLVSLFDMINAQFRTAARGPATNAESLVRALPALERIVLQAVLALRRSGTPPSPGINALFNAGPEAEREIYITYDSGRIYLVTAHAPSEELNADAVETLRELVRETRAEVPGVNVGITGEPVLEIDEMVQSQKDTTVASVVALVVCSLIFVYGYNETGRPIKATVCLVVGIAYTLAFATLVIGHLNILTITFVPILIGLAIDFGVHLITRYEEELRHGLDEEGALAKAMIFTGQGIFTGAFTTAGAFLAMGLTDFKGIQEMGVICGGGMLICLVPMMTLLPVLLLRGRQNVIDHERALHDRRARIEEIWLKRPRMVIAVAAVLCVLAASQVGRVRFDYNLLNMQSAGLPAVVFQEKLIEAASVSESGTNGATRSVLFAAVIADSLEEAVQLENRIKELPAVASVDSIASYLTQDPTEKLKRIGEIKRLLADIQFKDPDAEPVDLEELSQSLYALYGYLGSALAEVGDSDPELSAQLGSLRAAVQVLRKEILRGDAAQQAIGAAKLASFQRALFRDVRDMFRTLQDQDDSSPMRIEDLPKSLRNRFIGVTGKVLLQVYPKKDVWQRDNQEEFIRQLQTVDPMVTGTPVQLYFYTELLRASYVDAAYYALGAVVLLVLLHFRNIGAMLMALAPVGMGCLWLSGFMGFMNLPFNPANIMTLPLVIGIGVTNGIHILNRFAEEHTPRILARSTGKAVLVSGLTTIAGFGSLILAQHRGIQSLGIVMSLGVASCMIAALMFLPALLNLFLRRTGRKQPSVDNAQSTLGREEPR